MMMKNTMEFKPDIRKATTYIRGQTRAFAGHTSKQTVVN